MKRTINNNNWNVKSLPLNEGMIPYIDKIEQLPDDSVLIKAIIEQVGKRKG